MNSVHFSTGKDDWGTPQDLFDALNEELGERRRLRQDLQERCGITELEAINIINGFHIDTYCIKYLRKAREAAEGTPEPTKKRRRR